MNEHEIVEQRRDAAMRAVARAMRAVDRAELLEYKVDGKSTIRARAVAAMRGVKEAAR